jgi:hypothetical protein
MQILGTISMIWGSWATGLLALATAPSLARAGITIDWDKLRCDLDWYRVYLYNGLRALHDVLSLGGLVHPYKGELSVDETVIQLFAGQPIKIRTGGNILKSKPDVQGYPAVPWSGKAYSWLDAPTDPVESPSTRPILASAYPSGFLDDTRNPFGTASVFDPAPFPFATAGGSSNEPLGFINAADAVIAWLTGSRSEIPDRNLDGDRGLGYRGWQFVSGQWTNPVNIQEEN